MTHPKRIRAIAEMDQRPDTWIFLRETPSGPEYQRESGDRARVLLSQLNVLREPEK